MNLSPSERLRKLREKKNEEDKSTGSSSKTLSAGDRLREIMSPKVEARERAYAGNKFGIDTLESDLKSITSTINTSYTKWQDADTLKKTKTSVEEMKSRLEKYKSYQEQYGGADLSDFSSSLDKVLGDWDKLSSAYGQYKTADAFDNDMKRMKFDAQFSYTAPNGDRVGLSYDEVQEELKKYKEGSDEYNYLMGYTGYTDLRDFDKAIARLKGKYVNSEGKEANMEDKFQVYPSQKDSESATKQLKGRSQGLSLFPKANDDTTSKPTSKGRSLGLSKEEEKEETILDQLERAKNVHALDNLYDYYKDYESEEGYKETSKYDSSVDNEIYKYINDEKYRNDMILNNTNMSTATIDIDWYDKAYDYMQDNEKATYNHIFKKYGEEEANKFLDGIEKSLRRRKTQYMSDFAKDEIDKGTPLAWFMNLTSPVANLMGGVASAVGTLGAVAQGEELDPYANYNSVVNFNSAVREHTGNKIAENTDWEIGGVNVPSFLYQTGMSIGDTVVGGATLGTLYSVVAGTNAFQQKAYELKEEGESDSTLWAGALTSGLAETVFEYIGIEHLFNLKSADSIGMAIKNALKQAGAEGLEEVGTEITNILTDTLIRGDNSELMQKYNDMIARGYTEKEASIEIAKQIGSQVAQAGIGGALSGFGLGGATSLGSYVGNKSTGADLRAKDRVGDMWNMSAMTPEESETYKAYTEYFNKGVNEGNIKDAQLGNLYNTSVVDAKTTYKSKDATNEQKADALMRLKDLGKMTTPKTEVEKAVQKRVKELNVGEVTEVTATGNSAKLEGIKLGKDKNVLTTSEGEFAVEDMTLSQTDADLVSYAETMGEDKGTLLLAQYDGQANVSEYVDSFELAYEYGEKGYGVDEALKLKGVLNTSQVGAIYNGAITNRANEKQRILDDLNAKHASKTIVAGIFDDSAIDYKNTGKGEINWKDLNPRQRNAIRFAKAFSKVTGVNIVLSTKGNEEGFNGYYDPDHNTITLDVYAGLEDISSDTWKDSIVNTLSHEITHWMEAKSPALYNKIREHAMETMGMKGYKWADIVNAQMQETLENHPELEGKIDEAYAEGEIIARYCEDMLANSKTARELLNNMTESEQKSFVSEVKKIYNRLIDWVNDLLNEYKSDSYEAKTLREYKERLEELSELWDKALKDAIQTNQNLQAEGTTAEKYLSVGLDSLRFNRKAVDNHKSKLEELYSNESSVPLGTLMSRYDKIIGIWDKLGGELNSKFLEEWNNKLGKDRTFTIFKAQAGYKYNVELSSMCKKGVPLFEAIDTIVKNEVMKELKTKTLGKAEKEILYDILKKHHFEIPCAICYVEQARQREGVIIDAFLDGAKEFNKNGKATKYKLGWNEVLQMVQDEMKANGVSYEFAKVDRSIATDSYEPMSTQMDEKTQEAFYNALKKIANKEIDRYNKAENKSRKKITSTTPTGIKDVFKGTLPANLKLFKTLFLETNSRFMIDNDLLYSSETTRNLSMAHKELYSLFNAQGGVSGYKTKQGTVVYWGDILSKKYVPSTVRKEGGIRNQSNSDFQMYTLLDQVQMYIDFTAKGYYLQAYTKVLSELKLLGLSRGKINASLIPNVHVYYNADGTVDAEKTKANAGLDENGNPIFDDIEGIRHDEAFMLIEDEEYSKSICGICIGYSDNHIMKLLDDNRIQQIIGFHDKTDDGEKRYRGAKYAKNYNGINEAIKIKSGETVHIGFNQFIGKAEKMFKYNKKTEMYEGTIDHNGTTYQAKDIPKLATQLYLEYCESKNYYPAYSQGETDFSKHPNYYKLLADFGLYDSKGNYAPHRKVAYNMPDQVPYLDENGNKAYMKTEDYIKHELEKELKVRDDIAVALADQSEEGIIPEFKQRVNELHEQESGPLHMSDKNSDKVYLELAKNPQQNEARLREMVEEVARRNGYNKKMFHETDAENIHVFDISRGDHGGTDSETPYGIFTKSSDNNIGLGSRQMELYVKAEKTLYVMDRQDVKNKIPQLIPYYDEIARIDKKYDALKEEADEAELNALDEWMDENPDADMDKLYPTQYIIDKKPADIDYPKYQEAFKKAVEIGEEWTSKYNAVAIKCKEIITSYLRDHEYDSMYFVVDGGSRGRQTDSLIVLDSNQVKSADLVTYDDNGNIIPLSERFKNENVDIRYSDKNYGYHAGDLGKAESYAQQGYGRGTGHFGTGTYFVGNPEKIKGYNSRNGQDAPIETVDFSKYNLFKVWNYEEGKRLHEALKVVDGGVTEEFIDKIKNGDFRAIDVTERHDIAREKFGDDWYTSESVAKAWQIIADKHGIEYTSYEDFKKDYQPWVFDADSLTTEEYNERAEEDTQDAYAEEIENEIRKQVEDVNEKYDRLREAYRDLEYVLGYRVDIAGALRKVVEHEKSIPERYWAKTTDSNATVFMKALGYEGIDVRRVEELDNTMYGSVIYDLKGEDLARKQEIGTARFQDRKTTSVYDVIGENESLKKQNQKLSDDIDRLKERLKLEKTVTNGNTFNKNQLQTVAGHIRNIANSNYDKATLVNELEEVYSYIVQTPNLLWDNLMSRCYEVAEKVLKDQRGTKVTDNYFSDVLTEIRKARISLTEEQVQEAKNEFGDNYRNAFMGRIMITKDGISLDQQWQEWAYKYPEIFNAEMTPADQITALSNIYNYLKEGATSYQTFTDIDSTRALAVEIYNQYWNVSTIRTTADKHDREVKRLNFEHRKMMGELRNDYKDRLQKQKVADDIHYGKIINNLRQKKEAEIKSAREFGKRRVKDVRETAEKNAKIKSITDKALVLNKWLTKNSKDEHIAEPLKKPVAYLLDAIDFSSKQLLGIRGGQYAGTETRKDISLSKALEQVHDMARGIENSQIGEDELSAIYGTFADFPAGFADDVRELSGRVNDIMRSMGDNEYVLNQMSLEDLQALDNIVTTMKSTVTKMNKFLAVRHAQGVAHLSQESINYLDSLGKGKVEGGFKKLLNWGNALPYYAFKRFGEGGQKVYEALMDGWDKFAFHTKRIIDFAESVYTADEIKKWESDIKTFDILEPSNGEDVTDADYEPTYQKIQMTVPQIMSLYCLQKREQAKSHLIGGGIRIADIETKKGLKKEVISQTEGVIFAESEIETIINSLTDRQREVADKLQEFMNTVCTDWGNEVSMLRFGYKAFGEENYFPIQSDKNNLAVNDETENNNSLFRLLNMSFTKSTIKKANNRVVISDIFDVFAQHTSDMAKYNALALPVLDSFKWYNYKEKFKQGDTQHKTKSLKQSLENAFGKNAQNYITTFLRDINGADDSGRDTIGKRAFTNAKIASVGANLRVILLQPTSYLRASAVIDHRYLIRALGHKPKIAKAEKYCGIAQWKSLGFYDTNIQRGITELIKHDKSVKDKVVEGAMKGAEVADKLTWGVLWNACELEVRAKQKDLKVGSEEFNNAIAKRLREIIYATQVVDSTMTRSQMMRSPHMYEKMLTSFASEPTLSYNMMQDAIFEIKLAKRRGESKDSMRKHARRFARVAVAYTITNAVCALVESGFDAYRDEEDEEMDLVAFMKAYLSNFATDMSFTAKVPYIKEIVSILQGFTSSRTDTQWMQSLGYAMRGFAKNMGGEGNAYTTFKNILKASGYLSGLPFYNAWRDSMSFLDKTEIMTVEELEEAFNEAFGIE